MINSNPQPLQPQGSNIQAGAAKISKDLSPEDLKVIKEKLLNQEGMGELKPTESDEIPQELKKVGSPLPNFDFLDESPSQTLATHESGEKPIKPGGPFPIGPSQTLATHESGEKPIKPGGPFPIGPSQTLATHESGEKTPFPGMTKAAFEAGETPPIFKPKPGQGGMTKATFEAGEKPQFKPMPEHIGITKASFEAGEKPPMGGGSGPIHGANTKANITSEGGEIDLGGGKPGVRPDHIGVTRASFEAGEKPPIGGGGDLPGVNTKARFESGEIE